MFYILLFTDNILWITSSPSICWMIAIILAIPRPLSTAIRFDCYVSLGDAAPERWSDLSSMHHLIPPKIFQHRNDGLGSRSRAASANNGCVSIKPIIGMCGSRALERGDASEVRVVVAAVVVSGNRITRGKDLMSVKRVWFCVILRHFTYDGQK